MCDFAHLHVHTQFSLLDGASSIDGLINKVKEDGMPALAITDHGNMFGVPRFVNEATKAGVKPIVGCEFYLARGSRFDKTKAEEKDEKNIYHQIILAKNQTGYKNLAKLSTAGFTEGFYYKPRIDKELIKKHKEGLIATTCCLASEINQAILKKGEEAAEKIFLEWLDIFGDDYYVELQRHGIPEQDQCNAVLLKFARKYNVKVIATNDVHYIDEQDSQAQDILLCLQTGKDYNDPNRMRFDGNQFFLKTKAEMAELFKDVPEAIENTLEIVEKIETPKITRDILLPVFPLPEGFSSEDDYLKHLSYEGAKKRYGGVIGVEVKERLDYELEVIKKMGFPGYFLIVQDFIAAARNLNVAVGPGRGSAAGSLVAYCTGITNIDPIKYNLLFERFLNPERVSMPDIDIDFDDDGRQKVIDWVVEKYGKDKVAQIITFGTMAAKSSIKDVARVLGLPLAEANRLAKLVPDGPGVTLQKAFSEIKELANELKSPNELIRKTLSFAQILEGSARHTGIHAAGVIIAPDKLEEYIPLCVAKDTDLLVTQYDGKYIESVGMLKMDFLGLKTLSIINDAVKNIAQTQKKNINIDNIPLDDPKTFELYQKGETIGTFQFESPGMQKYLKDLKPTNIEDLIAMNALYRPGPMDFIPTFINRKHGKEQTEYPHELLEPILKNTYGIMVYQEQIMQTAQVMGGFTLGAADLLRRAMGKKDAATMAKQKDVFVAGAKAKNIDAQKAAEVFDIMAKFAEYGFNRSHSAAYSVVAYQTAYLKANYPAEYMAAVLTRNMSDIKQISFFMDESKRMNIPVLGPNVNESNFTFTVNAKGEIRFGLGAIKGVGESAVQAIVQEREKGGPYKNIFDFVKRINLKAVNKKTFESLALSGAFDCLHNNDSSKRSIYATGNIQENLSFLDKLIKYGNLAQQENDSLQASLFGGETNASSLPEPELPTTEPWPPLYQLSKEKEVIGIYLSGHPLDDYKIDIQTFCNANLELLEDLNNLKNKEIKIAGIISDVSIKTSKTGNQFANFTLEDYTANFTFALFGEDFLKMKHLLNTGALVFLTCRIQERYNNPDYLEPKITSIQLLSELRSKKVNQVEILIDFSKINQKLVQEMTQVLLENKGNTKFKLTVLDNSDKMTLDLTSKSLKIEPSNKLIQTLEKIEGIKIKLNP